MTGIALYTSVQAPDTESLVLKNIGLVKRIAYHLMTKLPANVQVEDLIQAGMLGLLEAARLFDPNQGASFETYAGIRIRGAMLDELRRNDWTPRSVHRKTRDVAEAIRQLEDKHGREARDAEVAESLSITLTEYHQILRDSASCHLFSMDELLESGDHILDGCASPDDSPFEQLARSDFTEALAEALSQLPERERLVMSLYYDEELNLKEIGQVLGVSESRSCQILGQATLRLRARMRDWMDTEVT
ncbi:MAG: RNA polymerase sigma factor FliA [Methylococcaceae bacterium]